jgi:hypothetical protein
VARDDWENYVNRLHKLFSLVFPKHLGLGFPRRRQEEINEMVVCLVFGKWLLPLFTGKHCNIHVILGGEGES